MTEAIQRLDGHALVHGTGDGRHACAVEGPSPAMEITPAPLLMGSSSIGVFLAPR